MANKADNKFTAEQRDAIDTREKGIIVSAAAGSGKTTVLIERMVQLLSDEKNRMPADRLLAITFTNDAAAQMRDKLNAAFEEKLRNEPDNIYLLSQQNLLQLARISTINSFCLDFVKNNLEAFDFQGGLTILDENVQQLIYNNAADAAIEDFCTYHPKICKLLMNTVSNTSLNSMLQQLYVFLRSLPSKKMWEKEAYNNFNNNEKVNKFYDMLFEKAQHKAEQACEFYRRFEALTVNEYEGYCFADFVNYNVKKKGDTLTYIEHDVEVIENIVSLVKNHDIDGIVDADVSFGAKKSLRSSKKTEALPTFVLAHFNDIADSCALYRSKSIECIKSIKSMFPLYKKRMDKNMKLSGVVFKILCNICRKIDKYEYEQKLDRNGVDFQDVEYMSMKLLVNETENGFERTELAEEIRNSHMYEAIFIDEFQDVNNLQEMIFRVMSDTDDINVMGKNIFVVGDIKQSIYRFRLSNPKLFANAIKSADDVEWLKSIKLNKNFRSNSEILDFTNYVFSEIMTVQNGDVKYDDTEKLVFRDEKNLKESPVEIMLISQHLQPKYNGFSDENLTVAKRISGMIGSGYTVNDHGKERPCCAADFCVLVQKNSEVKRLANALEYVGLTALSEDTDGYMRSREIMIVTDILRVIDNPMNDIALTGCLLSPVMSFTADDVAEIRVCMNNNRIKHFYQLLVLSSKENDIPSELADNKELCEKCVRAYELIERLTVCSMSMGLEKLIRKIYSLTDLMGITSVYLDSEKKIANLRLLLEYAASYEDNSTDGVNGFLRYLDSVSDNDKAFKQAVTVTESGDCVNVKTYHSSKGLEYPFVFLCQLDNPFFENDKSSIRLHNDNGCSFVINDNNNHLKKINPYNDYLTDICHKEEQSERMRLLYVGCTRAKEKLFVSCYMKTNGIIKYPTRLQSKLDWLMSSRSIIDFDEFVSTANSMLDWLMLAMSRHRDYSDVIENWLGSELNMVHINDKCTIKSKPSIDFAYYYDDEEAEKEDEAEQTEYAQANAKIVNQLAQKYSFDYDMSLANLSAKMSVTEIVSKQNEENNNAENEFYPNLPRLDDEFDKLTNAERGTFTHKFMECANYSAAEKDTEAELERLVDKGFFTKHEADGVYLDKLSIFFKSDFYKRMKKSDNIMREKKFMVSLSDITLNEELIRLSGGRGMIQGIADCIFHEDDGYVLVDYKTDHFKDESGMNEYKVQLELYKAALELILGERIKSSYIYSFWLSKGKEISFN